MGKLSIGIIKRIKKYIIIVHNKLGWTLSTPPCSVSVSARRKQLYDILFVLPFCQASDSNQPPPRFSTISSADPVPSTIIPMTSARMADVFDVLDAGDVVRDNGKPSIVVVSTVISTVTAASSTSAVAAAGGDDDSGGGGRRRPIISTLRLLGGAGALTQVRVPMLLPPLPPVLLLL
jgi:hypothetical protein